MVIFYQILIIDPCVSDVNPITSCSRVVKCVIFKELVTKGITHLECVWILIIIENWKYCSKIIFKYVNSVVGPIFNKKKLLKSEVCETHEQCTRSIEKTQTCVYGLFVHVWMLLKWNELRVYILICGSHALFMRPTSTF